MEDRPNSVFQYNEAFEVNAEVKDAFDINGYIILRGLLDSEEVQTVAKAVEREDGVLRYKYPLDDGDDRHVFMSLWNQPGNDVTGMVARCKKIVDTFEKLLGGEIYHYHTKLLMKEPRTGGKFLWHQDYGYWYNNGILFPDMGTVWVAIDKTDEENGSLKAEKILPLIQPELEAGDAMFFHSNVLHRSEVNDSDRRRWGLAMAYNRKSNNPVTAHHHPFYSPLAKVDNDAIRKCNCVSDLSGKDFFLGPDHQYDLKKIDENKQV